MSGEVKRYSTDKPLAYHPISGETEVYLASDYDALHAEAEALRAENGRHKRDIDYVQENLTAAHAERVQLRQELETARGLLGDALEILSRVPDDVVPPDHPIYGLLRRQIATSAPEVPDHLRDSTKMVEQGERQEVRYMVTIEPSAPLYAFPPPDPDVRPLVEALEKLACLGNGDRPGNSDGNLIAQAALAAYRNPATVKRCPTCTGTCAEICAKARP